MSPILKQLLHVFIHIATSLVFLISRILLFFKFSIPRILLGHITFISLFLQENNVIVLIFKVHTPWCFSCETTSKQIEKLAKHFKGLEHLTFARIDVSANEHPKLEVSVPKIFLEVQVILIYCTD